MQVGKDFVILFRFCSFMIVKHALFSLWKSVQGEFWMGLKEAK